MDQKITLWTTKSVEFQKLPPFQVSFELENARVSVDGSQKPDRVVFEMENVPMSEGMMNFFKKFAKEGDNFNEMVIDTVEMKGAEFVPSLIRTLAEFLLKSTSMKKEEATSTEQEKDFERTTEQ